MAQAMGDKYGFHVISDPKEIEGKVDIVFASEYFEHFLKPVDHLIELITATHAKSFIIANSFGTKSVGHFIKYQIGGKMIEGRLASRLFNLTLAFKRYHCLKTTIWNNKPSIWVNPVEASMLYCQ